MRRALEEPIRQIVSNAGAEASIVVQNVVIKKVTMVTMQGTMNMSKCLMLVL